MCVAEHFFPCQLPQLRCFRSSFLSIPQTMLYVFAISGAPWLKVGITSQPSAWDRVRRGFWTNAHPAEVCGKLGFDGLVLLALFQGGLALERLVQSRFPADSYEFWHSVRLPGILEMLRSEAVEIPAGNWPPRPEGAECADHRPCCGGRAYDCFDCARVFATWSQLKQHRAGAHSKLPKVPCPSCGGLVKHARNMKAHQKICRGRR